MSSEWTIGVVGGSGVYAIDGLEDPQWIAIDTPWGAPSDELLTGRIEGVKFVFLPRHGRGHRISPSELNARANIDALKRAGCTDVISLSAIGSLQEHLPPGKFVVMDQFVDRTFARAKSFFGTGCVAHVSVANPVCPRLSAMLAAAGRTVGADIHEGATQLVMEGPQFSTRAESRLYRQWGCDVIGMTAMPEAKLAREAELPYAVIGMVTDYDSWREGEGHVEVDEVIAQLMANSDLAKQLVVEFARSLPAERLSSPIDTALDVALMTAPEKRDPALMAKLDAITARVLGKR